MTEIGSRKPGSSRVPTLRVDVGGYPAFRADRYRRAERPKSRRTTNKRLVGLATALPSSEWDTAIRFGVSFAIAWEVRRLEPPRSFDALFMRAAGPWWRATVAARRPAPQRTALALTVFAFDSSSGILYEIYDHVAHHPLGASIAAGYDVLIGRLALDALIGAALVVAGGAAGLPFRAPARQA